MNWSTGGSTTTGEEWKMSPSMRARLTVTEVVVVSSLRMLYPRTKSMIALAQWSRSKVLLEER